MDKSREFQISAGSTPIFGPLRGLDTFNTAEKFRDFAIPTTTYGMEDLISNSADFFIFTFFASMFFYCVMNVFYYLLVRD